jgi:hypothetical protein
MMTPGCQINCKVANNDKGSTNGDKISDYEPNVAEGMMQPAESSNIEVGDTEPEEDNIGYVTTKAIGDADYKVSLLIFAKATCKLNFD